MKLTVLMPVFNAEAYLQEAITSVLEQTWNDFELLLINDGSTDRSLEIINAFEDPRIRVITHEKQQGVQGTLNHGLEEARGEYVARMDADDLMRSQRIEKQVQYLDQHPEVVVIGSWVQRIDSEGEAYSIDRYPLNTMDAIFHVITSGYNPLCHPAVMYRKQTILDAGAYFTYYAQDAALWLRLLEQGHHIANLPEVLLDYRVHGSQVSQTIHQERATHFYQTLAHFMEQHLHQQVPHDIAALLCHQNYQDPHFKTLDDLKTMLQWRQRLFQEAYHQYRPTPSQFLEYLSTLWDSQLALLRLTTIPRTQILFYNIQCCLQLIKTLEGSFPQQAQHFSQFPLHLATKLVKRLK